MIYKLYGGKIDAKVLREALEKTSRHRGTFEFILQYKEVGKLLKKSDPMLHLWDKYVKGNPYAKDINFLDTVTVYEAIGEIFSSNI